MKDVIAEMKEIVDAKNSDYSNGEDSFSNFRMSEIGGISADKGIYIRLGDKVARLSSFLRKGSYEVRDEKIHDTALDLANYALIAVAILNGEKDIKSAFSILEGSTIRQKQYKDAIDLFCKQSGKDKFEYCILFIQSLYITLSDYYKINAENFKKIQIYNDLALVALLLISELNESDVF